MAARFVSRSIARHLALLVSLGAPASVFAQTPPTEWTFSLGAREAQEFSRIDDGIPQDERVMDAVNASLGLSTTRERDEFGLFGRVGANVHRAGDSRDRINYGAGLFWGRQFSTQSHSRLSLAVDRGFRAETLSDLGLLAPGADNFATTVGWTVQHQATPRTAFSTSISYHHIVLESDEPILGSQIVPEEPPFLNDFPPLPGPSDDGTFVVPDVEDTVVDILATEGLSTTQTDSHHANAGFGVNHRISEYSTLGFDLMGGYRVFDSDTSPVQDHREGANAGMRVWTQRRVGQSTSIGSSYQLTRSLVQEPPTTVQNLVGTYGYTPSQKDVSLSVSAGAGYYQAGSLASQVTPVVNASFSAGLTSSTRLGATYRRQFSQSLGFGRSLLIDYANLALTQGFGSRVDLTLRAGASSATDPLIERSGYDVVQAGGTLRWRILDSLSLGTGFFDMRREQTLQNGVNKSTRNLWTVFISYTTRWR